MKDSKFINKSKKSNSLEIFFHREKKNGTNVKGFV